MHFRALEEAPRIHFQVVVVACGEKLLLHEVSTCVRVVTEGARGGIGGAPGRKYAPVHLQRVRAHRLSRLRHRTAIDGRRYRLTASPCSTIALGAAHPFGQNRLVRLAYAGWKGGGSDPSSRRVSRFGRGPLFAEFQKAR